MCNFVHSVQTSRRCQYMVVPIKMVLISSSSHKKRKTGIWIPIFFFTYEGNGNRCSGDNTLLDNCVLWINYSFGATFVIV